MLISTFDLVANLVQLNHGIDLTADGKTLFVSSETTVYSYAYDATAGTVGAKKTVM
jgi:sugar lactone lactonase YvrE